MSKADIAVAATRDRRHRGSHHVGEMIQQPNCSGVGLWPDSEVAECADDFHFLGYSGLVVLTASLSERDSAHPTPALP